MTPDSRTPGFPDSRIPVFVNGQRLHLAAGDTVARAVALYDPAMAEQLATGAAYVTDGRGIRIAGEQVLYAGAILRVVVSSRRNQEEADAHP